MKSYNPAYGLMQKSIKSLAVLFGALATVTVGCAGFAQVIPDTSLGAEQSTVSGPLTIQGIPTTVINGGATRGSNLFHSFSQFSPTNGATAFNNAVSIQNIITRVTGGIPSNINGIIAANGKANLILINPSGIQFGPNAFLNLGGSFLGTTAQSVVFQDGFQFTALSGQGVLPLLTNQVPVGLGFGNQPQPITVESRSPFNLGIPTQIPSDSPNATPSNQRLISFIGTLYNQNIGLQPSPGQTIALVGGNVNLNGGNVNAIGGNVNLAAVGANSVVGMTPSANGWTFDYSKALRSGSVSLTNQASVTASGSAGGNIEIVGDSIGLTQQSTLFSGTLLSGDGGRILLNANDVRLSDGAVVGSNTFGSGSGPAIEVNARNLALDRSLLFSLTLGTGAAGPLQIGLTEDLSINGALNIFPRGVTGFLPGGIVTISGYDAGANGGLNLTARRIQVSDQAFIAASSLSNQDGKPLTVQASDSITLRGGTPLRQSTETEIFQGDLQSGIFTSSYRNARAGNALIETGTLNVLDGAAIDVSALTTGTSGNLVVRASREINVVGQTGTFRSGLYAGTIDRGAGGTLLVETPKLLIDRGILSVASADLAFQPSNPAERVISIGNAGTLRVRSSNIRLDNGAEIRADAGSGRFGDVAITAGQLRLLNQSRISANSTTTEGGNIGIDADVITLFNNSRIAANSLNANGGRVLINSQGVFSDRSSQITATSALGQQLNGRVDIQTPDIDPARGSLPQAPAVQPPQVVLACESKSTVGQSQFVVSGTGGVPEVPDSLQQSHAGWVDPADSPQPVPQSHSTILSNQPIEAQGWVSNGNGTVRFVAEVTDPTAYASLQDPRCPQATTQLLP